MRRIWLDRITNKQFIIFYKQKYILTYLYKIHLISLAYSIIDTKLKMIKFYKYAVSFFIMRVY
jgi:hypothetical protein